VAGVEYADMNSGELLQKKSVKFNWLRPSLNAPLHQEDLEDEALLLDTFVELRVVDIYVRICSCRQCWASKCRGL
jgi:hypothetical protein